MADGVAKSGDTLGALGRGALRSFERTGRAGLFLPEENLNVNTGKLFCIKK